LLMLERMDGARAQTAEVRNPEGALGGGNPSDRQDWEESVKQRARGG